MHVYAYEAMEIVCYRYVEKRCSQAGCVGHERDLDSFLERRQRTQNPTGAGMYVDMPHDNIYGSRSMLRIGGGSG